MSATGRTSITLSHKNRKSIIELAGRMETTRGGKWSADDVVTYLLGLDATYQQLERAPVRYAGLGKLPANLAAEPEQAKRSRRG